MSMRLWTNKKLKRMLLLALMIGISSRVSAQRLDLTIHALPESGRVTIEARDMARSQWSFIDSYATVLGLAGRIENFQAFDEPGAAVQVRRLAPGQFASEKPATHIKYEVNLSPPVMASDAALVSWLTRDRGLLMLGDLLPLNSNNDDPVAASVRFETPGGYAVLSQQAAGPGAAFVISDITRSVFALGAHLRTSRITESSINLDLIADGEWAFSDNDLLDMVRQILRADHDVFAGLPAKNASIILFPYPQNSSATQWSAETRGANVTLLMGKLPSKVGALSQLSTPLTHELFHLWVPNALALKGDYDWFYEGFTMYQAARIGVRLNLLTFPQFLNTVAHAYDVYLRDAARDRWSLLEASRRRWTGGASSVYSKSLLVALLIDLKMRAAGNHDGLDDLYQQLFAKYQTPLNARRQMEDGNDAVIALLSAKGLKQDPVASPVTEATAVDLTKALAPYGLSVDRFGANTRISVAERLTKRQRDLLRELGYNAAGHSAH